jgi:hypothetical protein
MPNLRVHRTRRSRAGDAIVLQEMKRWITAAAIGATGLALLAVAAKLNGDLDAYHLAQHGPHGQFTGAGQEFLIVLFVMFLVGTFLVAAIASGIGTGLKWRRVAFQNVQYSSVIYWALCIPIAVYVLCFPIWALWHTIGDCMEFLW